jgi:hypothetical protein
MGGLSYGPVLANVASIFIIGLGVIAALSQIGIAIAVTLPVLITVLATVAGILIVGVGGGLISPMRQRLEQVLSKAEQEASKAAQQARVNSGQAMADVKDKADPNTTTTVAPAEPTAPLPSPGVGNGHGAYTPSTNQHGH